MNTVISGVWRDWKGKEEGGVREQGVARRELV